MKPDISIVIPVYNSERVLGHCISSILKQSHKNIEVILVNDGSADNSLELCNNLSSKDDRIRVIDKKNEGRVCARRDGFLEAQGRYVAFSDHDDYMPKNALEHLILLAEKYQADMVVGSHERVFDNWRLLRKQRGPFENSNRLIEGESIYHSLYGIDIGYNDTIADLQWGRIYKKEVIQRAFDEDAEGLFPSKEKNYMHEDMFFNLVVNRHIERLWITDEVVYSHRYGGASRQNNYRPMISVGGVYFDKRYQHFLEIGFIQGLPRTFFKYLEYLYQEIYQRLHLGISSEKEIEEFIRNEAGTREIVLWARDNMPTQYRQLPQYVAMINADTKAVICETEKKYQQYMVQFKLGKLIEMYMSAANCLARIIPE